VSAEHHDLRRAVGRFLEAKRALGRAYRDHEVSPCPSELIPTVERGAVDRARNGSAESEQILEMKEEIERLRKTLALLHAHCLSVEEERDALLVQRDKLRDSNDAVTSGMRDNYQSDDCLKSC
jgi:hypothetical protein